MNAFERRNMKIKLPEYVAEAIASLIRAGFDAYAVGGCVRDSLLGCTPADWDICTSALPGQTARVFSGRRVIKTGLKHGTVTVIFEEGQRENIPVEITTYRVDGAYSDNRRPDSVEFTANLREDLRRRDFTINAMAYNPKAGLVDFFSGREDIERRLIRCVGEPSKRFGEDGLRILRALRFAACLGFQIEEITADAIRRQKKLLSNIARERIGNELQRLLRGVNAGEILLEYIDVLDEAMPGISSMPDIAAVSKSFERMGVGSADICARLALLLAGYPGDGRALLEGIRLPKTIIENSLQAADYVAREISPDEGRLKRLLNKVGAEQALRIIAVKKALGEDMTRQEDALSRIISTKQCFQLTDLEISGHDLLALGHPPGREIGRTLNILLEMVMDGELENKRSALVEEVKKAKEMRKNDI
ncbi:MAG: CCA tRNA nucleotidyltransferase [Christensenellales bacterium]|jgi:tRNA nucleotidyltransferase (CCA-adding enzyme)